MWIFPIFQNFLVSFQRQSFLTNFSQSHTCSKCALNPFFYKFFSKDAPVWQFLSIFHPISTTQTFTPLFSIHTRKINIYFYRSRVLNRLFYKIYLFFTTFVHYFPNYLNFSSNILTFTNTIFTFVVNRFFTISMFWHFDVLTFFFWRFAKLQGKIMENINERRLRPVFGEKISEFVLKLLEKFMWISIFNWHTKIHWIIRQNLCLKNHLSLVSCCEVIFP